MIFNKIYFIKYLLSTIVLFLALSAIINYIVDSHGIFHDFRIKSFNKYKYMSYQGITAYRSVVNIEKYDLVIFGTSRSANLMNDVKRYENLKILNLSDNIYGRPKDIYEYLDFVVNSKHKRIKKIIIALDFNCWNTQNKEAEIRNNLAYKYPDLMLFASKYSKLMPSNLKYSFDTINRNMNEKLPRTITDNNGTRQYIDTRFVEKIERLNQNLLIASKDTVMYFKKIREICTRNKIDLVFYTYPFYQGFYGSTANFEKVNRLHLSILPEIGQFYNFSYINDITASRQNYYDYAHHNQNFDKFFYEAFVLGKTEIKINNRYVFKLVRDELK